MNETLLRSFLHHLDPEQRIHILRSSNDPDLARYLSLYRALGSTHMEPDKQIYVKIHDAGGATKAVWLEELAHARQFMEYGPVELSADRYERHKREVEVAECLLANAERLKLTVEEIEDCKKSIAIYGEYLP